MRLLDSRMPGVEMHVHMIDTRAGDGETVEFLVGVEILDGDHVDGADQLAVAVVGEERPCRQRRGVDEELAQTRNEVRELHELAHLLIRSSRWRFGYGRVGLVCERWACARNDQGCRRPQKRCRHSHIEYSNDGASWRWLIVAA